MIYFIGFLVACRVAFWLFGFVRLALYSTNNETILPSQGVSILICIKNNLEGLKQMLPRILKQNYGEYEIVIMDDFSSDHLEDYLQSIDNNQINYYKTPIDLPGKKQSVMEGISHAKYDWILQIDSDCRVASLDWVKHMMNSRKAETKIVLGVSPLEGSQSFVSLISAYESMYIAMQYLSFAIFKKAYMGVGRNLLFHKSLFQNSNPYADNKDIASGDDDFLVQCFSNDKNTEVCIEPNAMTYSHAPTSVRSYLDQKTRHVSTSMKYKSFTKYTLALFGFLHLATYFFIALSILAGWITLKQGSGCLLMMWSIILIIQIPIFSKMKQGRLIPWTIISDTFLVVFYLILSFKIFYNPKQDVWKS